MSEIFIIRIFKVWIVNDVSQNKKYQIMNQIILHQISKSQEHITQCY